MRVCETRCDRCKTVIYPSALSNIIRYKYHKGRAEFTAERDLCDSCLDALKAFMKNELKGGKFKPVNVCTHHVTCAGPCQTYYVPV